MKRLTLLLPIVALLLIAAVGPLTASTATTIAIVVMAVSPVVLKFVKVSGPLMAIISFAVAVAVTLGAGFLSGELTQADFSTTNLYVTMGALWAVQQAVFQLFKDNKTFGAYLK